MRRRGSSTGPDRSPEFHEHDRVRCPACEEEGRLGNEGRPITESRPLSKPSGPVGRPRKSTQGCELCGGRGFIIVDPEPDRYEIPEISEELAALYADPRWREHERRQMEEELRESEARLREMRARRNHSTKENDVNAQRLETIVREAAYRGAYDATLDAQTKVEIARAGSPAEEAERVLEDDPA